MRGRSGFTLAEALIAVTAFVVAALVLIALAVSLTRVNRETVDRSVAQGVGRRLLERTLRQIRHESIPVTEPAFWSTDYTSSSPLLQGTLKVGATDYDYQITATTVRDVNGDPVGAGGVDNGLKKVEVLIKWFDEQDQGQARAGYGKTELRISRLVGQGEDW